MSWKTRTWKRLVYITKPHLHRAKQIVVAAAVVGCTELTLLSHYWPTRRRVDLSDALPMDIDSVFDPDCNIDEQKQALVRDILLIYQDKLNGMYHKYFHPDVITEDHFFRWIGAKELRIHQRYARTMVPEPTVSDVRVLRRDVEPNPEKTVEQLIIAFQSKMKNQIDEEAMEISLVLDLNKEGLVVYQRELAEHFFLISSNDTIILGILNRLIRRANSFWLRCASSLYFEGSF